MMEKNTQIIAISFKQRAYDGKWMRMGKVFDETVPPYRYSTENGSVGYIYATKWIVLGVYDYLLKVED